MYDLITIGDVTIDIFFRGSSLTVDKDEFKLGVGNKYPVDTFYEAVGGGAANVAIWCSSEGMNTAALAKIGENPFKQIILQKLIKRTVSTEFLIYDKSFYNISAILLTETSERTIIHYATPNETLIVSDFMIDKMKTAKAIYMGNLPGISVSERVILLSKLKDDEKNIYLNLGILDCERPTKEIKPLIDLADVLIMNTIEFSALAKKGKKKIEYNTDVSELIGFKGAALVVTDGANGSYGYSEGTVYKHNGATVKSIVDTTGAGDSFTAGFISSYINSPSIQGALKHGTMLAKRNLESVGAN